MDRALATCPIWLEKRIKAANGAIRFSQYMDWCLNDPNNGAYGSGRLRIGKQGDFATSPSLGSEFAELLAVQVLEWFRQLDCDDLREHPLTLVDIGPGEGHLARDLIKALKKHSRDLIKRIQVVLVESNKGMISRQKVTLAEISEIPIFWKSLNELAQEPVLGVVIANELLDAFPVERIVFRNKNLYLQGVTLLKNESNSYLDFIELPLPQEIKTSLEEIYKSIGLKIPPDGVVDGWCSEWHYELSNWFELSSKILFRGSLLIIDYALEAFRYYNPKRSKGTLMSYKNNIASENIFQYPGFCDITSHLCLETLSFYAKKSSWYFLGQVKQGEALLSLGLAQKLHAIQKLSKDNLGLALEQRENLLTLVDPSGLGGFRWIAFQINNYYLSGKSDVVFRTRFLEEPIL